jgi:hypothetical protein
MDRDGIERLKRLIEGFRRELLDLSAEERDPRQVVQINFQLFPLSSLSEEQELPDDDPRS